MEIKQSGYQAIKGIYNKHMKAEKNTNARAYTRK
jgi:hypothetical protein